jgi:hypothetical protein
MYVNDPKAGTVVVEFNVLSRSCNVSSYEFRFEVDESLNETDCNKKVFGGNGHSVERTIFIKYDERFQKCGKVSIIIFTSKSCPATGLNRPMGIQ